VPCLITCLSGSCSEQGSQKRLNNFNETLHSAKPQLTPYYVTLALRFRVRINQRMPFLVSTS